MDNYEVDFIIRYKNKTTEVEVKSADNNKSKSLASILNHWKVPQAIKPSTKNLSESNNILSFSLYMAMFL